MSKELTKDDYKRFTQLDFDYDKAKKKEVQPLYFVYPQYVEELRNHQIPLAPDMQDTELTKFIVMADPDSIEKQIPTIVRLRNVNKKGEFKGKKTEFLIWYENWRGTDKNGHIVAPVSDLPKGIDKGVDFSRKTGPDGETTYSVERDYWVYTTPFSAEKLDQILAETNTDPESVQYIVMGLRSWGGFSYDEFRDLSYEDLCERGRTGQVQRPVTKEKAKAK